MEETREFVLQVKESFGILIKISPGILASFDKLIL
jgi:hypothetical protein